MCPTRSKSTRSTICRWDQDDVDEVQHLYEFLQFLHLHLVHYQKQEKKIDYLHTCVNKSVRTRTTHKNFFLDFILFFSFVLFVLFLNNIIYMLLNYVSLSPMCTGTHLLIFSLEFFFSFLLIPGPKTSRWNYLFIFTIYTLIAFSPPKKKLFFM